MKTIILLAAVIFELLFLQRGLAVPLTRQLDLEPFNRIKAEGNFQIKLVQGSPQRIQIIGSQAQQDGLKISIVRSGLQVVQDTLPDSNCPHDCLVELEVIVPRLEEVEFKGHVVARLEGLNVKDLKIRSSGKAEILLVGKTERLIIGTLGQSFIDAYGLSANEVDVSAVGRTNVQVFAQDSLKIDLRGGGTVAYKGAPAKVQQNIAGRGTVTKSL